MPGDDQDVGERAREADPVGVEAGPCRRRAAASLRRALISPDSSSLGSCPCAAAAISCEWPLRASWALVPLATSCWKIAPRPAMPVAMPTWRKVLLMPEAMPLRAGGTTPIAVEASGGLTMPMPMPGDARTRGSAPSSPRWRRRRSSQYSPAATSSRPLPSRSRTGTRTVRRPDDRRDDERQQRDRQEAQARPAAACSRARSGCRASGTGTSRTSSADSAKATMFAPANAGLRNSVRSSIGRSCARSTSTKAISSTAEPISSATICGRAPAVVVAAHEREHEQEQRGGEGDEADPVDAACVRVARLLHLRERERRPRRSRSGR